jgi:hypothetical protein
VQGVSCWGVSCLGVHFVMGLGRMVNEDEGRGCSIWSQLDFGLMD